MLNIKNTLQWIIKLIILNIPLCKIINHWKQPSYYTVFSWDLYLVFNLLKKKMPWPYQNLKFWQEKIPHSHHKYIVPQVMFQETKFPKMFGKKKKVLKQTCLGNLYSNLQPCHLPTHTQYWHTLRYKNILNQKTYFPNVNPTHCSSSPWLPLFFSR